MIILGGKKKLAQVVLESQYPSADKNAEEYAKRTSESEGQELFEIASDIMKAIKASDVMALNESLKAYFMVCESQEVEEPEVE